MSDTRATRTTRFRLLTIAKGPLTWLDEFVEKSQNLAREKGIDPSKVTVLVTFGWPIWAFGRLDQPIDEWPSRLVPTLRRPPIPLDHRLAIFHVHRPYRLMARFLPKLVSQWLIRWPLVIVPPSPLSTRSTATHSLQEPTNS